MVFTISTAIALILFLALFPMAFIWLRRAWRIFVKHDYSEVALKRGESPENPKKWAPVTGVINLAAGGVALWIIVGVPLAAQTGIIIGPFPEYDSWSGLAGSTIWLKICADFVVSRQAHPFALDKEKDKQA